MGSTPGLSILDYELSFLMGTMTFNTITFSIMTFSKKGLFATLSMMTFSIDDTQHSSTRALMLSVIMLNVTFYLLLC